MCEESKVVTKFFYFFECGYQVVPVPFVRRLSFLHCYLCSFVKDQFTLFINLVLFCPIDLFVPFLHQYHTVIIAVALEYVLRSSSQSSDLVYYFSVVLTVELCY